MKKLVTTREACSTLGVHPNTLRRWESNGKIQAVRTPGNKRLYDLSPFELKPEGAKIIYARVSTNAQKPDLQNQVYYLRSRYPNHELITDIGSSLNFKRKGFTALLERILLGEIQEIVVAHKDRLCRFGFDLVKSVASHFNTTIVVLDETCLSPNEELVRDLVSIIHVFSSRIHGLRKYNKQIQEDKDLSKTTKPSEVEAVSGSVEVLVQSSNPTSETKGD
jgi:excisionase family DNA binding protein